MTPLKPARPTPDQRSLSTPVPFRQFVGFQSGQQPFVQLPDAFFADLLPLIDDLAELKVTLYCFWALQQRQGEFRYIRLRDMADDTILQESLGGSPMAARALADGLNRAIERGSLLQVRIATRAGEDTLYFMNTPRGRRAQSALKNGDWQPGDDDLPIALLPPRPNLFALYEQNIGPLTPLIADTLKDAEQTYPAIWMEKAIQIAVERNKRNWRYVESILKRWYTEGKTDPKTGDNGGAAVPNDKTTERSTTKPARVNRTDGKKSEYERFWDAD